MVADPAGLGELSDAGLEAELTELARVREQAQAAYLDRLRVFHERGIAGERGLSTRSWAAGELQVSPRETSRDLAAARTMAEHPEIGQAARAGDMRIEHVRVITDAKAVLPDGVLAETASGLVEAAKVNHPTRLRASLRAVARGLDSESERRRARRDEHARWLDVSSTIDGAVALQGVLDAESGATVLAALTPLTTRTGPDDERPATVRRADALVELARQNLDGGRLPRTGGERPHVHITVPLDAITSAADSTPTAAGGLPARPWLLRPMASLETGEVLGETALRRLLCDATITRVVLDPDSLPLDVGRQTRLITPAQRRALRHRDNGCRYPGCDRPHEWTDAHHMIHWLDGGPTDRNNLVSLCRRHHTLLHEGTYAIRAGPGNTLTFTLANGSHLISHLNPTPVITAATILTNG
ncbi:MAG TPA: DUF222 domain-containing protein [Jiangellaceae bacterium]|nr:DUF222 domain-containing protein [Jiangellaceae bacterium]